MARRDLKAALTSENEGLAFVFGKSKQEMSAEQVEEIIAQQPILSVPRTAITTTFSFSPNQKPARHHYDRQQIELWARGEIAKNGIRSPLWVRPAPISGYYELIAGLKRYTAAEILDLNEVPVVIFDLDDKAAFRAMVVENSHREEFSPLEDLDTTLNLLAIELDLSQEEVISLLYRMDNEVKGKVTHNVMGSEAANLVEEFFTSGRMTWRSFVSNRMPLLKKPPEILEAIRNSEIEYTKGIEIAKVKALEARSLLLKEVKKNGLSLAEIKQQVKQLNNSVSDTTSSANNFARKVDELLKRVKALKRLDQPSQSQMKALQNIEQLLDQIFS